jgi:hypothetical protein
MEQIKSVVKAFVAGGDNHDISLLETTLNIQNGFFGEEGIFIFSKEQYIELVRSKKFGGSPRSIDFVSVENEDNIANVKVVLESQHLRFFSTIICVFENAKWQVISNIPKVEVKKTMSGVIQN